MAMLVIINQYFIMVTFCISLMAFHIYWSFVYPQNEVKSLSRVRPFATPWIFPTQVSNPGVPYYRQMLYPLSHQGRPKEFFNAEKHLQKW